MSQMGTDRIYPLDIHIAVDGSEHSIATAQLIRDLPLPNGSFILVFGLLAPHSSSDRMELAKASDEVCDILTEAGVEVVSGLLHGQPVDALLTLAYEHAPDLLAIGSSDLRAVLGYVLTGMAQRIVESSNWPVLVGRAPYQGMRRVLVAIDGSEYSRRAVLGLTRFPLPKEASINLLHIIPDVEQSIFAAPIIPAKDPETIRSAMRRPEEDESKGRAVLSKAARVLRSSGFATEAVLLRGDPAQEIISFIERQNINLVICGSRGLGAVAVKGFLLGSVSRKLVSNALCPVLVFREGGKLDEPTQ